MKSGILALVLVLSTNVSAEIISVDWQTTGDNLITYDTTSGLNWLDLTETNNLSYEYVSEQFGSGDQFDGFRYATPEEVINLWANFGIDLSSGATWQLEGYIDLSVPDASYILGDTMNEYDSTYYGAQGITFSDDAFVGLASPVLGAYISTQDNLTQYITVDNIARRDIHYSSIQTGSYLVSIVPVPSAIWLFSAGLISLMGFAKRKKS